MEAATTSRAGEGAPRTTHVEARVSTDRHEAPPREWQWGDRHGGEIGEIYGLRWDGVVPGSLPLHVPPDRSPRVVRCRARAAAGRRRSGSTRSCPRRAGGSGERPNLWPAQSPPRSAAQCEPDEGGNQHAIRDAIRGHPDRAVSASRILMREAISMPSEMHSAPWRLAYRGGRSTRRLARWSPRPHWRSCSGLGRLARPRRSRSSRSSRRSAAKRAAPQRTRKPTAARHRRRGRVSIHHVRARSPTRGGT